MPDEIFVELLNEGIPVWRPVAARRISETVYEILDDGTYDRESEEWIFLPGTRVRCAFRKLCQGEALVAVARVDDP
jgi:hypothetical protein